jgi:hypothetical protein
MTDGEADCPVFSDEELDKLVEVELDSFVTRGFVTEGCGAATVGGFTDRRYDANIVVFLLWAQRHE